MSADIDDNRLNWLNTDPQTRLDAVKTHLAKHGGTVTWSIDALMALPEYQGDPYEEKDEQEQKFTETASTPDGTVTGRGALAYFAGYQQGIMQEHLRALGLPQPPSPPPPPPPACVAEVLAILADVSSDDREKVIQAMKSQFCIECGSDNPNCRCWDDS